MEFGVERDTIADSILDWIDGDSNFKLNGAEEDYYQGLEEPYSCKDAYFDVVEELLLVNGVRDQEKQWVFYGKEDKGEKRPGLRDLVTTFVPRNTPTNLATAPEGVLKAMKKARKEKPTPSDNFSIIATGRPSGGAPTRSLRAVVRRNTGGKPPFILLYWNDNYSPE